jgi:hypothetical protein
MTDTVKIIGSVEGIVDMTYRKAARSHVGPGQYPRTPAHSIGSERLTIDMNHWMRPIMETSEATIPDGFPWR